MTISNPRSDRAVLKRGAPIALIKAQQDPGPVATPRHIHPSFSLPGTPQVPGTSVLSTSAAPSIPVPGMLAPTAEFVPEFDPAQHLKKIKRKFLKKWVQICNQKIFEKSVHVEEKFPYFKTKPKIPFGLKDKMLLMRVGINQDCKPVRVLDRVNGVFTCTVCDKVVLDRYSLQDHWYSAQHKDRLRLVQVSSMRIQTGE